MSESLVTKLKSTSNSNIVAGRLFVLEVSSNRIYSMRPDGSDRKVVVADGRLPDGVVIDVEAGHLYWTNMGSSPATNDGSIERADLDGGNRRIIVPPGGTYTPKQIQLDKKSGKLYWSDREGMRVMRANLDGSRIETLVETGRGDADRRDQTRRPARCPAGEGSPAGAHGGGVARHDARAAARLPGGGQRRPLGAGRAHDRPRTYASTVPAQPILSSPWRSA